MSNQSNRECPFCAETIKASAKLCPRCRQWLTWRSMRNPGTTTALYGFLMVAFLVICVFAVATKFDSIMNPPPYYSEYPAALRLVESSMHFVETRDGLRIYITGLATNQSPIAWQDLQIDYRFFDSGGKLVDAGCGYSRSVVGSNADVAFRVSLRPAAPTNSYSSVKASVGSARNTRGLF